MKLKAFAVTPLTVGATIIIAGIVALSYLAISGLVILNEQSVTTSAAESEEFPATAQSPQNAAVDLFTSNASVFYMRKKRN